MLVYMVLCLPGMRRCTLDAAARHHTPACSPSAFTPPAIALPALRLPPAAITPCRHACCHVFAFITSMACRLGRHACLRLRLLFNVCSPTIIVLLSVIIDFDACICRRRHGQQRAMLRRCAAMARRRASCCCYRRRLPSHASAPCLILRRLITPLCSPSIYAAASAFATCRRHHYHARHFLICLRHNIVHLPSFCLPPPSHASLRLPFA